MLSSFSPIESLKGKLRLGKDGAFFRKALVVFQFGVSVLLIVSITIILTQMQFVKKSDLGFSKEQSVIVRLDNNDIWQKKIEFKDDLKQIPAVQEVSLMSGEPGGFHDMYTFRYEGRPNEKLLMHTEFADFQFTKTLGLKIIAGRDFSPDFKTDSDMAVLINRKAAVTMGYTPEQAIGKWIKNLVRDSVNRKIIGVLEDYHYSSLKDPIGPLVVSTSNDRRLALIRLKTNDLQSTVKAIRKAYINAAPSFPFEYEFLDDRYNHLYKSEMSQETVLSIFSAIAIFIACLGLFGLASYTAVKRTKEIGVRKVLGSSIQGIVMLLSKDLLKPVLIGTLIALPLSYYIMNQWLEGFAYRISIQGWMFLLGAMLAILIALITVSIQAIKAAIANPIRSLRTE